MSIFKSFKPIELLISFLRYKVDRLRLAKIISQGLKVGKNVYIGPNVIFDSGYPFLIEIGDNCRISYAVSILVHDATAFRDLGLTRLAPVKILEDTFIGTQAIILPGVTIGPRAVIAAGSVVNRDIGEGKIAAGNPARPYGNYSDIMQQYSETASTSAIIDRRDFESGLVSVTDLDRTVRKDKIVFMRRVPAHDPYYVNTNLNLLRINADKAFQNLMANLRNDKSAD